MHLSSVHSWCHFITHILNISKHRFKRVCACVCMFVCVCWVGVGVEPQQLSVLSKGAHDGYDSEVHVGSFNAK